MSQTINRPSTAINNRQQPSTTVNNHHVLSSNITFHQHIQNVNTASSVTQLHSITFTHTLVSTSAAIFGSHRSPVDGTASTPTNLAFPRFCALSSWSVSCYCVLSSRNIADRRHTLTSIRPNAFILLDTGEAQTTTTQPNEILAWESPLLQSPATVCCTVCCLSLYSTCCHLRQ